MYSSEKNLSVSQAFQQTKQKNKNTKPKAVYRDLLDNEKNLLNFQFSDYHDHEHYSDYRTPKISKTLSYMDKRQLKQNYLQGNFRFLVNPDYEENITYVDPDQEVKWKTVEKVKYMTNNMVVCSICLNDHYEMIQPKITRCGHIFCWPCVMRYLSYDKTKCPLCDDFLMKEDLRTVQILHFTLPADGEKIHLKLKKRRRTENTVYNSESFVEEEDFVRIKKVSWEDILKQREEETRWLLDYLNVLEIENDKDLKPYVEQCLTQQSLNIEKIQKAHTQTKQRRGRGSEEEHKSHHHEHHHEDHIEEEFMHFYQEVNGLNVFLHPINNKYLKQQYHDDTSLFPLDIKAPIVEIRGFQQTDQTQRRYKFLNHLPLCSDISFVEIDMKDLLSPENQQHLKDEKMETYKHANNHTSTHKKEKAPAPIVTKPSVVEKEAPPKRLAAPTDSSYHIQFPVSPSTLKLNDTHDYPELSAAANQQVFSENNAWGKAVPSKKKDKLKKSVSVNDSSLNRENDLRDKMQLLVEYEEQKKEKENISEIEDEDGWYCVKEKQGFRKGKNH